MSFENGVFLPGPVPPPQSSSTGESSPTRGSSRGSRSGRSRGPRQQTRLPSLMGDHHQLDNRRNEGGENDAAARFGFAFNPDAPSFQPSSTTVPQQQQQHHHNFQSRRGHYNKPAASSSYSRGGSRPSGGDNSPRKSSSSTRRKRNNSDSGDEDDEEEKTSKDQLEKFKQHHQQPQSPQRSQKPDIRNQRERLSDQLGRNAYDCMICVERIRRIGTIWSCSKCFNVFHLRCVSTWANSSKDEVGWRCPGCQSYYEDIPTEYRCFCGRVKNPEPVRSDVPHSCGQPCGKTASDLGCNHPCSLLCHPGPCPPCEAIQSKKCCCGKISAQVKCSSKSVLTCGNVCDKGLNCGVHSCSNKCHAGDCDPCAFIIQLECHCKSEKKEQICDENSSGILNYSCDRDCDKLLSCKSHNCPDKCHPGVCGPCSLSPEVVRRCPCGQTGVDEACLKCGLPQRRKCLDPIPVCGKTCGKSLLCGGPMGTHKCSASCHSSPKCPTCPLLTNFKCRCGTKTFELSCEKYDPEKEYRCEKRCTKKKSCGRHKCNAKCCMDEDHICLIVCDRPLRCSHHNCSLLCHNGHCPKCRVVSFHELACECGASVIYPPVPCGTRRPPCTSPCGREHDCDHPVMHHCHSDLHCPPCTMLTEKWCHGKHVLRKNVMCHIKQVSCGMPCKKMLSCGKHYCERPCHPDECLPQGKSCTMACSIPKPGCGHICGALCHPSEPCPESKCKVVCEVVCPCGRQTSTMPCFRREKEYERLVCYLTNLELKRLRNAKFDDKATSSDEKEPEIDADAILSSFQAKTPKTHVLECDKECSRVERNRKMVEALQLEDPDATSTFGTPNYCEFLTVFAKKNPQFVENVHDRLTALVVKAKRSKRKNETYGFESMNRDKRRVVHEYSDHFGCLSESFDEEPNRNVVCTASKEKSYLPAVSLVDAVFRPNLCSGRKNAFKDVEITQNTKSHIMRPANGKMWSNPSNSSTMIPLVPATTLPPNANFNFMQNSTNNANSTFSMAPRNPSSSTNSTTTSSSRPMPSLPGADFPPLS